MRTMPQTYLVTVQCEYGLVLCGTVGQQCFKVALQWQELSAV